MCNDVLLLSAILSFPPDDPSIVSVSVSKDKLFSELIADAPLPVNKALDVKVVAPVPPFDTDEFQL